MHPKKERSFFSIFLACIFVIGAISFAFEKIVEVQLDKYSSPKVYDVTALQAPVLRGAALSIFEWILEKSPFSSAILRFLKKDSGVTEVLQFAAQLQREYTDAGKNIFPTYFPLVPPTPEYRKSSEEGHKQLNVEQLYKDYQAPNAPNSFHFWNTKDFADAYRKGTVTPLQVAEKITAAILAEEKKSPSINAFAHFNEDFLIQQAKASTERFKQGKPLSLLDGVPVVVKDELHVKGFHTRVGTSFLGTNIEQEDATSVDKLRKAGALIVGKNTMQEIGIGVHGHNQIWGIVRNAYNTSHYSGGSSSGTANSVAAGFAPIGVGADGGGSIRIPASFNGVVGLKATFGRISEHGAAPLCWTVSHVGPIGASVFDVAVSYAVMAGVDSHDKSTLVQPSVHLSDLEKEDLSDIKIGVFKAWVEDATAETVSSVKKSIELLKKKGAKIVEVEFPHLNALNKAHTLSIASEIALSMERHMKSAHVNDFGVATKINLLIGSSFSAADYIAAQQIRTWGLDVLAEVYEKVDVLVIPATAIPSPAIVDESAVGVSNITQISEIMRFACLGNFLGNPAIVVPTGDYTSENIPLSVQFMGRHWEEHTLLRLANIVEKNASRKKPQVYYNVLE